MFLTCINQPKWKTIRARSRQLNAIGKWKLNFYMHKNFVKIINPLKKLLFLEHKLYRTVVYDKNYEHERNRK